MATHEDKEFDPDAFRPSGHSSFSWAVVGAVGELFPDLTPRLGELAAEASWSRVLAGVHYPSDCHGGQEIGLTDGRETVRAVPDLAGVAAAADSELHGDRHGSDVAVAQ